MPRHASVSERLATSLWLAEGCRYCSVVTVQKQDRDTAECHQVTIIHRHYLQGLVLGHYNALSLMTWTTCET